MAKAPILALAAILLVPLGSGCLTDSGPEGSFVDVADEAGIDLTVDANTGDRAHPIIVMGGGIAVGDVNGDDWPDFYVAENGPNGLFINQGDGTFREATKAWGVVDRGAGRAPVFFDYDNDDDLDLFVGSMVTPSRLYRNDGDRFTDVTEQAGVGLRAPVFNVAVGDYDQDKDLDLFAGLYHDPRSGRPMAYAAATDGVQNVLFRNEGNGTFTNVADEVGLTATRWTLASAFEDVDLDGDLDLYVVNDFGWDALYINQNGTFVDRGPEMNVVTNRNGMGVDFFDHDGDGDLDIYVTNIFVPDTEVPTFTGNVLYENRGGGTYEEVASQAGVANALWSWDGEALDAESDGDMDLYVVDGFVTRTDWDLFYDGEFRVMSEEEWRERGGMGTPVVTRYNDTHLLYVAPETLPEGMDVRSRDVQRMVSQAANQPNRFFFNDGSGSFTDRASEVSATLTGDGRAIATVDYDRDGDLDVITTNAHENVHLLENRLQQGHWLKLDLDPGPERPHTAVGARVEVVAGDRTHVRTVRSAYGFMSQSSSIVHVGLGETTQVDEISIRWPWGQRTVLEDVAADQRLTVTPDGIQATSGPVTAAST